MSEDNREDSLLEIYERIKVNKDLLGLVSFRRTPTEPVDAVDMPCVFMLEGADSIIEYSSRSSVGYPVRRTLEVTLELIVSKSKNGDTDIKSKLRALRRAVFAERDSDPVAYNPRLLPKGRTGVINESRTEGPTGYGLPDILCMSLVLDLVYTDNDL
jgi:hypothetical protein